MKLKFLSPWNKGKQTSLPDKLIKLPSTLIRITYKKQWNFKTLDKNLHPPTRIKLKRISLMAVFENSFYKVFLFKVNQKAGVFK